jgi:two-component system chemotaxis response regulator CheB
MQINDNACLEMRNDPPHKGLRPSANYLLSSLAQVFGPQGVGVILTGMGDDGVDGIDLLHKAGGLTIAQDEQSCVVFGMPREAIERRAVDYVMGIERIGPTLLQLAIPAMGN